MKIVNMVYWPSYPPRRRIVYVCWYPILYDMCILQDWLGALRHVDHNVITLNTLTHLPWHNVLHPIYLQTPFHTSYTLTHIAWQTITSWNIMWSIFIQDQLGELLHGDHYDHWDHRLFPQLFHWQDQESEDRQPGKILDSTHCEMFQINPTSSGLRPIDLFSSHSSAWLEMMATRFLCFYLLVKLSMKTYFQDMTEIQEPLTKESENLFSFWCSGRWVSTVAAFIQDST